MSVNKEAYLHLRSELDPKNVTLVAVSKIKPVSDIRALYDLGQRDFGENYVQELVEKQSQLPDDIRWHFIGHLQSNKVKYIAPFVHLIHGVDSFKLLQEIDKQARKNGRVIDCLLQVHIAMEETKFGLDANEVDAIMEKANTLEHARIRGIMGMASFVEDEAKLRSEFRELKNVFSKYSPSPSHSFNIASMGMSSDYGIAIEEGSTMVRVGSLLFGRREYQK